MEAFEEVCDADDRPRWLAARRTGIGGSDIASILGANPWKGALAVWADKTGKVEDHEAGEAALWGSKIEPLILEHFGQVTGRKVQRAQKLLRSRKWPFLLATLDGEQWDAARGDAIGCIEIKVTSLEDRWEDGPPQYVVAQIQQQLAVTDREWTSVAALFNGRTFWHQDFGRDEQMISEIVERGAEFWGRVELEEAPEATAGDKNTLAALYPKAQEGLVVELGADFVSLDEEIQKLKGAKKEIDLALSAAENKLRQAIGEAAVAKLPNGFQYKYAVESRAGYTTQPWTGRVLRRGKVK